MITKLRYSNGETPFVVVILPLLLYFLNFNLNMTTISLIKLSDGSYIKTYRLLEDEVKSLVANNIKSSKYEWECDIFILKNDEVILHQLKDNGFGWFSSYSDLKKVMDDFPIRKPYYHFFEGHNIYGKDFPKNSIHLIKTLLSDLGLDSTTFTLKESLIAKVDKAIQYHEDPQMFMITHILHLSALVGEVFLAENNNFGWYLKQDLDGLTWLPEIRIIKDQEKYSSINFIPWIYDEIMFYSGQAEILESSYLSLNDFKELNPARLERDSIGKIRVVDGKIIKD